MPDMKFDFEQDLNIDLSQLHIEFQTHAATRHKYSNAVAEQDRILKKANEKINMLKAMIVQDCKRENAKATVQQIEAETILNADHTQLKNEIIDIEYILSLYKNAVKAMDDRKSALETIASLWKSDYFATPTEPMDNSSNNMKAQGRQETETKQRATLKRKRKNRP